MGEVPANLEVMDLRARGVNDEALGYAGWNRKRQLHTLAKANNYQTNKPLDDGDWWGFEAPSGANSSQAPRCNLPTAVTKISAVIPATGGAQRININEEVFLIRDEMGPWNASQMMSSKAIERNFVHLDVAAQPNCYPIPAYASYIPAPAANIDGYISQFVNYHKQQPNTTGLEREHVSASVTVFTCGLHLYDTLHVQEHFVHVHGLPNGVASLKQLQTIILDKDTTFVSPDLRNIEDVGAERKKMMITSVYNQCIAKQVFVTFNGGRADASLSQQRSQEFLNELKKKCQSSYYGRFAMNLTHRLLESNQNIEGDFTTRWHVIEECLYSAVSDLEGVARMDSYLKLQRKKFSGSTLEVLMHEISREVNNYHGVWDKEKDPGPWFYCLKIKYELIYELVSGLGEKYSQLKECIRKEMAGLFWDNPNIKEITELQTHLLKILESKCIASHYNKDILQVGNAKLPNLASKADGLITVGFCKGVELSLSVPASVPQGFIVYP